MRRHSRASFAGPIQSLGSGLLLVISAALLATLAVGGAVATAAVPSVSVENASTVRYFTAHAKGKVDPVDHDVTNCHFDYATEADYQTDINVFGGDGFAFSSHAQCEGVDGDHPIPAGSGTTGVNAVFTSLNPGTTYHLRLVAENADGEAKAVAASTFEAQLPPKPIVTLADPSAITGSTAHFAGTVNPNATEAAPAADPEVKAAFSTTYRFTCNPGCPGLESHQVVADNVAKAVSDDASDLIANQNYEVTLEASNAGGTSQQTKSFKTPAVGPEVETNPTHGLVYDDRAELLGSIQANNSHLIDCHFEYGTTTAYGKSVPCPAEVQEVRVQATGGQFRLRFEGETTDDLPFDASASEVQAALTALTAIDGSGGTLDVSGGPGDELGSQPYRIAFSGALGDADLPELEFEEGTEPLSGPEGGEAPGIFIGTVTQGVPLGHQRGRIAAEIIDLKPLTAYHFRLVATNGVGGSVPGEDRTLTTTAAPQPQGPCPNEEIRIEQDSTRLPDCMAYELVSPINSGGVDIAGAVGSADGNHAWVRTFFPVFSEQIAGSPNTLISTRTPSGWQQRDLAEPRSQSNRDEYIVVDRDEEGTSLVFTCKALGLGCLGETQFQRVASDGSRSTVLAHTMDTIGSARPDVVAASADLTRAIAEMEEVTLSADDTHQYGRGLYIVHDNQREFIGVDENGQVLNCGAALRADFVTSFAQSGFSRDGRTAVFVSPDPRVLGTEGCPLVEDLYLRRDGQSFNISAPRNGNPDLGAKWIGQDRDAEVVYFSTASQLVAADTDEATDIYAYHTATDSVQRITPGADVRSAIVSPNGAYVYFTAGNPVNGEGTHGAEDLYVYHGGSISRITWMAENATFLSGAETNSDGTRLLFASSDSIVGSSTNGHYRIFQYDANTDTLACVSCNPNGAPASENVFYGGGGLVDERFQSNDGVVVFTSSEQLRSADTNTNGDLYRWDHGSLSIITDPSADIGTDNPLVSTTADGESVFFKSSSALTSDTKQRTLKLYVARVNGGFRPPPTPTPCQGEGCRGPAPATPAESSPASAAFSGAPSPKPKRHKGKKRRKAKHHRSHGSTAGSNRGGGK